MFSSISDGLHGIECGERMVEGFCFVVRKISIFFNSMRFHRGLLDGLMNSAS